MEEQLKSAQECLRTAAHERDQVRGTKKTVPVDEPEDEAVAVGQFDGDNRRRTPEAMKAGGLHPGRISEAEAAVEASGIALGGKGAYPCR